MNRIFTFFLLFLFGLPAIAQEHMGCSQGKIQRHQLIRKKSRAGNYDNSLMSKYDVHFYFLDFKAERNNTLVSGSTTIGAIVTASSLDTFCFEFNGAITIDSILWNNQPISFVRNAAITYALLPTAQLQNTDLRIQIFYDGDASVTGAGAIGDGYSTGTSQTWGNSATWSLSEPYSAYEWFPCKQMLQDKADSAWIFVTTSNQNKVGSNGLLEGIDSLSNNKVRYRWKTNYMIDYYLISVAIARYVEYTIYAHPSGLPNDSVMVMNYVYNNVNTLPSVKTKLDTVALVLEYYSDLFGLYPFHAEKYGNAMAPFSGGMEHQTMTSAGFLNNFGLNAHELMHQWWGDHVTCKTWKDIFINEGFASYGEYLAYEHFRGLAAAQQDMLDVHDDVLQDPDAQIYFTDTTNVGRIFDSRQTYNKGNAICHSLRFELGDSLFFKGLKTFQSQFSFATAGINDLKVSLENSSGLPLGDFFDQWIYGAGHPIFSAEYFSNGNFIFLKINHSTSSPVTPLYKTPLEINCKSLSGDTTIKVYVNQNSQTYVIPSSKSINGLEIDPNNWLLNTVGTITENAALQALSQEEILAEQAFQVYPNPATDRLSISQQDEEARFTLRDMQSRIILQGKLDIKTDLNLSFIPSGVYLLEMQNSHRRRSMKIQKH